MQDIRDLLVQTTNRTQRDEALAWFRSRLENEALLEALITIALEGEDAGDAPWAAANVITEFPAGLLLKHKAALERLSQEQWIYLSEPAKLALDKVSTLQG